MRFETERLVVRDFQPEDLASLIPLRSDPEVAKFMDFTVESPADTARWLAEMIGHNHASPRFSHSAAIVLREAGAIVGWIAVGHPENEQNGIAERAFGYALGRPFWGRGIMPEAIRGMIRFCFEDWKVSSVSAQCSKQNTASARALEKAGMEFVREFVSPDPDAGVSLLFVARNEEWSPKFYQTAWKQG